MEYTNYIYQIAKDWWYPKQATPLTPVQKLRSLLQEQQTSFKRQLQNQQDNSSNVESPSFFKTKHTNSNIIIERICMMYTPISQDHNPKYSQFIPINIPSIFFISLFNEASELKLPQNVGVKGQIKIHTEKIKCNLQIIIVFHADIQNQMPWIYILNPDCRKMQLNIVFSQIYKPIMGGVLILTDQLQSKNIAKVRKRSEHIPYPKNIMKIGTEHWSSYNESRLQQLIIQVHELLTHYFPYVKRYVDWNEQSNFFEQNPLKQQLPKKLREESETLLPNIQKLKTLEYSLQSETRHLKACTHSLEQILKKQADISTDVNKIVEVQQGQDVLEIMAQIRAHQDCLDFLEQQLDNKNRGYSQVIEIYKQICEKKFQSHFFLQKIIEAKQKENQ